MSEYPPGYREPVSADDVADRLAELQFDINEKHRQVKFLLGVVIFALLAVVWKLFS